MEEMVRKVPYNACPICGRKSFIVSEITNTLYHTGIDGHVLASKDVKTDIAGFCMNCKHKFPMIETNEGFIPMTPLRIHLQDYLF